MGGRSLKNLKGELLFKEGLWFSRSDVLSGAPVPPLFWLAGAGPGCQLNKITHEIKLSPGTGERTLGTENWVNKAAGCNAGQQ